VAKFDSDNQGKRGTVGLSEMSNCVNVELQMLEMWGRIIGEFDPRGTTAVEYKSICPLCPQLSTRLNTYRVYELSVMTEHNEAIWAAYNAAELKAEDCRKNAGYEPVDTAAQAALEGTDLRGAEFGEAYAEVWETIYELRQLTDSTDELAVKIQRLRYELL